MIDRSDVCVLVPTYDEVHTVGDVVTGFRDQGFEDVLIVDGGSTDGTQDAAREAGARVVQQSGSGKGQAVREAVARHVDRPIVLMVDGDETYRPEDADRMLDPIASGEAEHVIGNRFADMQPGAMTGLNRIGNRVINAVFGVVHGRHLGDILSGYRAFTVASFQRLGLEASGFGIETEMAVNCVKENVTTAVVPITYEPRPDASETNLRPFRDGGRILLTLYQMAKTNNPLFYFGSVGVASTLTGLLLGVYVAYEWFVGGVSHEVIALVAAAGVLLGIQLVMFGVLSDMILAINREQTRRLERLATNLQAQPTDDGAAFVGESEPGDDDSLDAEPANDPEDADDENEGDSAASGDAEQSSEPTSGSNLDTETEAT